MDSETNDHGGVVIVRLHVVVVVVVFFQYNQSWTSLPSIVLSSNRYLVLDAWSFENCWTVIPVHLQLLVPLTFWPLAEIGWAKCLFPHHQSLNPNAGCRCWHRHLGLSSDGAGVSCKLTVCDGISVSYQYAFCLPCHLDLIETIACSDCHMLTLYCLVTH